jgi:ADP-heptose:LPS heptosyltransferase
VRLLVVRRDNIGDLVCTTPLFSALRRKHPDAWIGALVNSYNAPVLAGNPDLDEVIAYTKLKHLGENDSALRALGRRLASLWKLRRARLDTVVLATPDFVPRVARLARWLSPGRIVGFSDGSTTAARLLDASVPAAGLDGRHEVERVFSLAAPLGLSGPIPPLRLAADKAQAMRASAALSPGSGPRIAVHISARRPKQHWPAERYAELIERLHASHGARVMLLWAPGAAGDPQHPGDDVKAAVVARRLGGRMPLASYRTALLAQLIGALTACDLVVCPDGGAMHLAAGLGKPVVALFGDSLATRWRPWGVPQRVLQPASRDRRDLGVDEVAAAVSSLASEAGVLGNPGA